MSGTLPLSSIAPISATATALATSSPRPLLAALDLALASSHAASSALADSSGMHKRRIDRTLPIMIAVFVPVAMLILVAIATFYLIRGKLSTRKARKETRRAVELESGRCQSSLSASPAQVEAYKAQRRRAHEIYAAAQAGTRTHPHTETTTQLRPHQLQRRHSMPVVMPDTVSDINHRVRDPEAGIADAAPAYKEHALGREVILPARSEAPPAYAAQLEGENNGDGSGGDSSKAVPT